MNMKSTLFAGLLAASLSVPAFASDTHTATPLPQFSAADTQMLFAQDTMPMQLAVLSQQEMIETEGAWGPWGAISGFGIGVWSYGGYLAAGNSFSARDAVLTVGGSTLSGAWGGPGLSVARYYGASRTGAALGFGAGSW